MINPTSLRESIEGSLGITLGFLADLLDFLVDMTVIDSMGMRGEGGR